MTKAERRRVKFYRRCARSHRHARRGLEAVYRWQRWRGSYRGYWTLRSESLEPWVHSTLARLRGCETRGIPYPANYRYSGSHHGAYQFLASTWQRAQGWVGTPYRHRTAYAYAASKDHQDAVTGRFWPFHKGEWACKV